MITALKFSTFSFQLSTFVAIDTGCRPLGQSQDCNCTLFALRNTTDDNESLHHIPHNEETGLQKDKQHPWGDNNTSH